MPDLRINDSRWQSIRTTAIKRDSGRCIHCGWRPSNESTKQLQVHHVLPERLFESPEDSHFLENLVTLCSMCHGGWEKETRRWLLNRRPSMDPEYREAVRNRIRKHLVDDIDFLQEHFEEGYELAVDEVCDRSEDGDRDVE